MPYDPSGKYKNVVCPICSSVKKEKLPTACNFNFSNPVGTDRFTSDSTGHDYRCKTKWEKDKANREMVEKKSHMGGTKEIYKDIDDFKDDKNFDFGRL